MQAREPFSRRPRLRAAHVTQIPQRVADLRQRGKRLCESGWDINAAMQLAEDAEALASTCRQLDESTTASRLESFAESLWAMLDPPLITDAQMLGELSVRLDVIDTGFTDVIESPIAQDDRPSTLFGYAAIEDNGFPLLVRPPSRYWQRFASLAPAERFPREKVEIVEVPVALELETEIEIPATDHAEQQPSVAIEVPETHEAGVANALVDAAATSESADLEIEAQSTQRKACHLHGGSDLAAAIDLQLGMLGFELNHVADVDALKEWLSRSTPALIMLDGEYQHAIDEVGALVQAARARSEQRVLLIAHGAGRSDLAARLRAMRAGCDAYIVQPESAEDVISRVRELDLASQAEPYRIMIVEDDRSQAFFAESILRKNGMQTLAVGDAADVLDKLDAFDPDLVLMDLNMPVCNGIELTALIREREAYISMPIVFLSGEGDTEKHFEALSAGGDDFLTKPIAPRHLITAVTSRVKRARQVARRRPASVREPVSNLQTALQINARLTEMLAMEDAATRNGGILFIALECADVLRKRLNNTEFDTLIERVTTLLRGKLGHHDLIARSGEAEFLLLNPDRPEAALEQLAVALRDVVESEKFKLPGKLPDVAVGVGICPFTRAAGDARAMIEAAEGALLDSPKSAEPSVVSLVPKPIEPPRDPIEEAVRQALVDSSFRVVFQPIVSLHGEEEKQFQALLRLSTESGRVYSATELIPAAESAGLIGEVDRWMLESCLGTIADHLRSGDSVRLFVNQSATSIRDPDRVEWLRQALESRRVPAAQISIDLRMEDAKSDIPGTIRFALAMKQIGISLTLSGVEAGDQATDMLMHLPVDFIKLSPRYTSDRGDDHRKELSGLVNLAHASGRKVIAPRVEEARIAASLWASGIDLIQGNFVQQATRDATYDFKVAHA